ncbi:MAG: zinc ribbon domain-containing protein [Oscillospiraceae bacterium]
MPQPSGTNTCGGGGGTEQFMDIFDKLGSKITGGVSAAATKTKALAGSNKLSGQVSQNTAAITDQYTALGKLIKEEFPALVTDERAKTLIADILALEEENEQLKKQIAESKGYGTCKNCGGDLAPNIAFCPSCGERAVHMTTQVFCARCGRPEAIGTKFCAGCGSPIIPLAAAPEQEIPAQPETPTPEGGASIAETLENIPTQV